MAMASIVTFDKPIYSYPHILVFGVWNYNTLSEVYVNGYQNGIVSIYPPAGTPIKEFVEFVSGIFHPDSNFASAVCEQYNVSSDTFRAIKFEFNEVTITVTKYDSDANHIYQKWYAEMKKK